MEPIKLVVLGDPKAQKRHRFVNRGKFVQTFDPNQKDKSDFLSVVYEHAPEKPFDEPLSVEINFYFSRPQNHFGTGRNAGTIKPSAPKYHVSKPDLDNLQKLILDSLNKIFWRDDSVICTMVVGKEYSDRPRTEIVINRINGAGIHR